MLKKALIITVAFCFLTGFTAILANAYTGGTLLAWASEHLRISNDKITQDLRGEFITLSNKLSQQSSQSLKERKEEMDAFLHTSTNDTKSSIENYHDDYLNRLQIVKQQLSNQDLSDYEKKKKEEINAKMDAEAARYLAEILGQ
ncbi:hypothetical protein ABFV99_07640 [Cytobacillus horneckiae]|uniref:hypothetical protein n=1 Tax=Cytobacillus horneckiae TaxID=549687 RepID=UPI00203D8DB5|nr:hypothetical protein [Cytobacillus horneckiae]MCM3179042.1 hypothetical protein [Cytobacillus horneckiae]